MAKTLPIVCVPGLACSPRLYAEQIPQLWTVGPVTIAQHQHHESMAAIARSILGAAPERFALIGLSMGGYVSFEILRQAPERVAKLALLDTSARPDAPEQTENRRAQISLAGKVPIAELADVVLCSTARGSPLLGENAAARIAQLNILDAIFVLVAQRARAVAERNLSRTMDAVRTKRKA